MAVSLFFDASLLDHAVRGIVMACAAAGLGVVLVLGLRALVSR